MSFVSSSRIWI